jgi:hypothetical protein
MLSHHLLRWKFVPYLEGVLAPRPERQVERHLIDCEPCRDLLVRLRAGHQMARSLERIVPVGDSAPEFDTLIARVASPGEQRTAGRQDWLDRLATPRAVSALAALVVVQLALLVVSNRGILLGERSRVAIHSSRLDLGEFRQLRIADLKTNTLPHVATDGYVSDVRTDDEEGTVTFRLAERPGAAGQFVICEIMTQMAPPRNGAHVRVYGVARYDAQPTRKWYEVNPVLNITSLE